MDVFLQDVSSWIGGVGLDTEGVIVLSFKTCDSRFTRSIFRILDRLDIWHRDVPWSAVKQLKTVMQTECSVDDVFDSLLDTFDNVTVRSAELAKKHGASKAQKMAGGFRIALVRVKDLNTASALLYRVLPLPWYVTSAVPRE